MVGPRFFILHPESSCDATSDPPPKKKERHPWTLMCIVVLSVRGVPHYVTNYGLYCSAYWWTLTLWMNVSYTWYALYLMLLFSVCDGALHYVDLELVNIILLVIKSRFIENWEIVIIHRSIGALECQFWKSDINPYLENYVIWHLQNRVSYILGIFPVIKQEYPTFIAFSCSRWRMVSCFWSGTMT